MLWQELYHEIDWQQDSGENAEQIIAQRAYDLVWRSVRQVDPPLLDSKYSTEDQIMNQIPDMTEWPEETSKDD
jgi:hypothetical protein